ncbi:hypothetical protein Tco_1005169 [Tanacetum coccineum]|uniref:Uncharacterized protein n=1 Tax=Tanacetum coccineum TaxID=301880 RepID=A0ABQ5FDY0_9ASTR
MAPLQACAGFTHHRQQEKLNVSNCPNEDSVDEGAQTEAPNAVRGKFINSSSDTEPTGSMPRQRVSSRGRLLKPTPKLLQLSNGIDVPIGEDDATLPSTRKRKDGSLVGSQTKKRKLKLQ